MSMMMNFEVFVELQGDWQAEEMALLNQAARWWDWCEYAGFLPRMKFSQEKQKIGPLYASSNKVYFQEILEYGANGGYYEGWQEDFPLSERSGFDPAVHQALLDVMQAKGLSLLFTTVEKWEGGYFAEDYEDEEDFDENADYDEPIRTSYVLSSDGQKFLVH